MKGSSATTGSGAGRKKAVVLQEVVQTSTTNQRTRGAWQDALGHQEEELAALREAETLADGRQQYDNAEVA